MKTKNILLASSMLLFCGFGFAQRTPTHPLDIKDTKFKDLVVNIKNWQPGSQPKGVSRIDDEFYISRQRPLKRITDNDYQAETSQYALPERKFCLWTPLDDPTSTWKALPRYCFEGDNFSMWSYTNIHGNWTAPWFRVTAGLSDVAHKNGVAVGCVLSIPYGEEVYIDSDNNGYSDILTALCEKNGDGTFKNSLRFVKLLKYYGIDGVGVNSEFSSDAESIEQIQDFFADCHVKAKEIGWNFQLHWYDGTNDSGNFWFDQGLGGHNAKMFGDKNHIVTDMMFSNYNTGHSTLQKSAEYAKFLGRDPYDYYKGFDIQGRPLSAYNANWNDLKGVEASIGFWGAHSQGLIHQSSTDYGTSDVAIQQAYLDKQELLFSGGFRNPANTPDVPSGNVTLANASMKNRFHGIAHYITAKSTIQQIPFVTRFNLGNGLKFYDNGEVKFDHKWNNLSTQDYLPTWRWWIVNSSENAKDGNLVNASLTWDDAYFGGSCLKLNGKTDFSRVKLFKTSLAVEPAYNLSLTYKMNNELETHAKLFVALKGNIATYKEIEIPAAGKYGEWTTFTVPLSKLGIKSGDNIAMIGIAVEKTSDDYNMLIGELALRNPDKAFNPVTPEIKEVEILRGKGSTVDFKMRYSSKDDTGEQKTYNDEVDTWYYEIFMHQKDQPEQLLTATTSWAAYVIDAPIKSGFEGRECRFGVRAVSPDGKQKSEIAWTEYKKIAYDTPSSEVVVDRDVIKPGEKFKVSLEDEMANAARSWKVFNSHSGAQVGNTITNAKEIELSLSEIGSYDLEVVNSEGVTQTMRGKIHVSPESTGAVPQINTLEIDKTAAETGDKITLSYTSRDGEGKVSRGLVVKDPDMLMIPAEVQEGMSYSYALWVKVDNYAHDKQGTNLIQKNTVADKWPHNNWGDLWVQIRPEWQNHAANEVSFNTMGWTAHDNPDPMMMTTGYSLNPGVWNHICITQNANREQQLFFNGKRVAGPRVFSDSQRREDVALRDPRIDANIKANIFIGGGGVYKAGLNATVDEVQIWNKPLTEEEVKKAMKGFDVKNVPSGLEGYYTFEEFDKTDSTFVNYGHAGVQYKAKMVVTEGSGGEKTDGAFYKTQGANNEVTGYPGIEGTLDIKTTRKWLVNGARISSENDKAAVVTYAVAGQYKAGVNLSNAWGEVEKYLDNIVEISSSTGISSVENEILFSAYPNPFVDNVNLRFADGGDYIVNIVDAGGATVQTNAFNVGAGDVVNVSIIGDAGLYIIQILKNNKIYKAVKVVKK